MATYAQLDAARRKWIQRPLRREEFSQEAIVAGVVETMQRCFAFALHAEIPVKEFVIASHPKELPISPEARNCLMRNAGDEDRHYHAFLKAADAYPVAANLMADAGAIVKEWQASTAHPIEVAGFIETSTFQITLTLMRVLGTPAIVSLGAKVSEDENRHQATNRGIMRELGYNPSQPPAHLNRLRDYSLEWLLADLKDSPELGIFKDELHQASKDLVRTGYSEYLHELTAGAEYVLPFENSNSIY